MIGAIIGDIVGSRFEFGKAPEKDFQLFSPECSFTDDTICTIAVADAVINERSYRDALLDWYRRYPEPMNGYGPMFRRWLEDGGTRPTDSCGNGAAMRVSPVGWLFMDWREVIDEAKKSAEVSHNHPEGIKGAQCVAEVIHWLKYMRFTKSEVERKVKKFYGYEIPRLRDIIHQQIPDTTCRQTVPMALRCFINSNSFEETIRLAVLCGGDTDTKACIAGSIAEAYYPIPDEIIESAVSYLPTDMLDVLDAFYNRCMSLI